MEKSKSQKNETRNETQKDSAKKSQKNDFLIVGIGASAGGVQALKTFFENVPADSNAAYVVILHLSPDHDSQLAQILQTVSRIPVEQVTEKVHIEPNHVYVVPPNESLSMQDGHIVVSPIHTVEERRAPVDIFFRTLAESHCSRAVAVILSGTGANGSMGIKRVKENGGAAFVQNPREAEFGEMSRNSIATELIDEVLNVAEIPAKIVAYGKNLGKITIPVEPESRHEEQQQALREIFTQLRVRTGHDFTNYKRPTVLRRIERRINVRELPDLPAYAAYLKENTDETTALLKDLLISVTNFFRDKEAFEHLEQEVIPKILHGKKAGDQIRLWIAGCATGEEAYSLAMLLAEKIGDKLDAPAVQIFATDIDEAAIAAARGGFYTLNDAADVSPERLRRFFVKEKAGFRVRRELREMILFANHNLLKDPPFSQLDLVTCRNLLIYFNGTAQERVLETFHFALKPGGCLFLGSSESVDGASDLYQSVSREQRIFQSRQTAPRISYPVPDLSPSFSFSQPPATNRAANQGIETLSPRERASYGDFHQEILEQYAPPSLIVNENFDIVHVSQKAGRYLQISGEPSHNLFKLIRPELRLDVSTAVYQAVQRQKNVVAENLKLQADGDDGDRVESVNVSVRPVLRLQDETARGFILIVFEQAASQPEEAAEAVFSSNETAMLQLEEALLESQSLYRRSIEQSEVQAEELKASNEELQAINEELRSATEELETGKEELQSVNEELVTVNQELKIKIEELSNSVNDFQNLMNSTSIGTIFLDRALRVKMFTPAALEIFNLIPSDVGRGLSDITHRLEGENLTEEVEAVLSQLQPVEREVHAADGAVYLMQITPYRTSEDRISGAIITFVNITSRKQAEEDLRESEAKYRLLFDSIDEGLATLELIYDETGAPVDTRFIETNRVFERQSGLRGVVGKTTREVIGEVEPYWLETYARVIETGEPERSENYLEKLDRWFNVFVSRGCDAAQSRVAVVFDDITERKQSEEKLRRAAEFDAYRVELGDALRPLTDSLEIQYEAVRVLAERLEVDNAHYTEIDDAAGLFRVKREFKRVADAPGMIGEYPVSNFNWLGPNFLEGGRIVINDAQTSPLIPEPERAAVIEGINVRALITVPLIKNNRLVAALSVITSEAREWTAEAVELVAETAERTWAAVERARAEEALRESEERFRAMFEQANVGIVQLNMSGQIVAPNPGFCEIVGYTDEEVRRLRLRDITHPEDYENEAELTRQLFAGEIPGYSIEKRYVRKDGSIVWGQMTATVVRHLPHDPLYLMAIVEDISERKQAEESIRFQAQLLDTVEQSVIATDLEGRVIYWNQFAETLYGWTAQEARGRSILELTTPEMMTSQAEEIMSKLRSGASWTGEFPVRRRDGATFPAQVFNSPITDARGGLIGIVGVSVDITERKRFENTLRESEERLRLIIRSVEDYAIITTDTEGIINGWNPGAKKIFGYPESEILGQISDVLFTPEDREKGVPAAEMKTAAEIGSAENERIHLRRDGSRFYASGIMQPLKDGKIDGFVKIARDMTERLKSEQALRDKEMLQKLVGAQEDERKRIARDLHDELGQLLTALRLKLEAVRKLCETNEELCGKINETQTLAKRVDDGVDFLAWELRPAALDDLGLRPALEKYVREWSHYAGITAELLGSNVKKMRLAPEAETNLYRIAQEALNNVHKHAKAKSVEISLDKRGKDLIVLIIADDGAGFNPKDKMNRNKGIGLIGMKERAALIGGTFEIESAPGKGTTVYVRVPIILAEKEIFNDK